MNLKCFRKSRSIKIFCENGTEDKLVQCERVFKKKFSEAFYLLCDVCLNNWKNYFKLLYSKVCIFDSLYLVT